MRPLYAHLGDPPHAPPAGEPVQVEEVRHCRGLLAGDVLGVVGVYRRPVDGPHAAVGLGVRNEVILGWRSIRPRGHGADVDQLQEPFVASTHRVRDFEVHDIPVDVADVDLGADLGEPAVVVLDVDPDPGLGREGDVDAFVHRTPVGTTPGNGRE